MTVERFFFYARERQSVFIKKSQGLPKPWTKDPIIQRIKFCCVFREDDTTTKHLRAITEPMRDKPEVMLATILYRWFNRMTTGDAIFNYDYLDTGDSSAFKTLLENQNEIGLSTLKRNIIAKCVSGPYVTGAYCIIGAPHMPKIDGILRCFQNVLEQKSRFSHMGVTGEYDWRTVAGVCLTHGPVTMESVWDWFRRYPRSGDFMAYELVTDLCYTDLLSQAPDRMTWANAGPGAIRGLNRIHGRKLEQQHPKQKTNAEMQELLALSLDGKFWRQTNEPMCSDHEQVKKNWPTWDMRTVEHTLCEFDKYERIHLCEGSVKGVYRGT